MQKFSEYDLIIDARSPREYAEDHIPGALNWPVVFDEEYAEVGTLHRTDRMAAYQLGVRYALTNMSKRIEQDLKDYRFDSKILVYCFRGGKRSRLWLNSLDIIGYRVEVLKGGWKAYRHTVNEALASVPTRYRYNVLSGSTGCGKTRLLYALQKAGAQVLDLEAIAVHRGSIIGAVPGQSQPTQKMFDSLLVQKLSTFDTEQPIWVEAESKKIGNVQLPDALLATMRKGTIIQVSSDMAQRVTLWREDYRHFEEDPAGLLGRLQHLIPLVGKKEFDAWQSLADEGNIPLLFETLMRNHYDPAYNRSILRNYPDIASAPTLTLQDLSPDGLLPVAADLRAKFE